MLLTQFSASPRAVLRLLLLIILKRSTLSKDADRNGAGEEKRYEVGSSTPLYNTDLELDSFRLQWLSTENSWVVLYFERTLLPREPMSWLALWVNALHVVAWWQTFTWSHRLFFENWTGTGTWHWLGFAEKGVAKFMPCFSIFFLRISWSLQAGQLWREQESRSHVQ